MAEFDLVEIEERAVPELLMPSDFDRRAGVLNQDIHRMVGRGDELLQSGIRTPEDRLSVIECGQLLQVLSKNVTEFYKPIKQAIDNLKQPILDREHSDTERITAVKSKLAELLQQYDKAQEAIEAAARAAAEAAQVTKPGELPLPVAVVSSLPAKTRGKVGRTTWWAEVTSLPELVKAVAEGRAPQAAVIANESFLNKRADSDREGMDIPGVIARKKESVHFRP